MKAWEPILDGRRPCAGSQYQVTLASYATVLAVSLGEWFTMVLLTGVLSVTSPAKDILTTGLKFSNVIQIASKLFGLSPKLQSRVRGGVFFVLFCHLASLNFAGTSCCSIFPIVCLASTGSNTHLI